MGAILAKFTVIAKRLRSSIGLKEKPRDSLLAKETGDVMSDQRMSRMKITANHPVYEHWLLTPIVRNFFGLWMKLKSTKKNLVDTRQAFLDSDKVSLVFYFVLFKGFGTDG